MRKNFLEKNIYLFKRKREWAGLDKTYTFNLAKRMTRIYYVYTFLLVLVFSSQSLTTFSSSEIPTVLFVIQIIIFLITAFSYGDLFRLKKVKSNPFKGGLLIIVLLSFITLSVFETPKLYLGNDPNFISSESTLLLTIIFAVTQEMLLRSIKPPEDQ